MDKSQELNLCPFCGERPSYFKEQNTVMCLAIQCQLSKTPFTLAAWNKCSPDEAATMPGDDLLTKWFECARAIESTREKYPEQETDDEEALVGLARALTAMKADLDRECGRLAACGVAAMEGRSRWHGCHESYNSASLQDVLRLSDRHEAAEQANAALAAENVALREAMRVADSYLGHVDGPFCSDWKAALARLDAAQENAK